MSDSPKAKPARRLSPDMIAALSAVLIGVCALGVSIYQANIMREQSRMMRAEQRASVWPNVAVEYSYTEEAFRLRLVNTGIGPAKIGPTHVTFNGKPVQTWAELLELVHPEKSVRITYSQVGNRVLPAGDFETVLTVADAAVADSVQAQIERLAVEICYCSIYEECWWYRQPFGATSFRERIESCPATEEDFRQ